MTSQKYSANKHAAKYDLKQSFIAAIPAAVGMFLYTAVKFFAFPLMEFTRYTDRYGKIDFEIIKDSYTCFLTNSTGIEAGIILCIFGIIAALIQFSFLSSKSKVNIYLSSGVDRRTMFKNRVISATLLFAVPLFIVFAADILLNIFMLGNASYILTLGITLFIAALTHIMVGYAITLVAVMVCHTMIETLFFNASLLIFPSAVITFLDYMCNVFLRGYAANMGYGSLYYNSNASRFLPEQLITRTTVFNPLCFTQLMNGDFDRNNIFCFACRSTEKIDESSILMYAPEYIGIENPGKEFMIPIFFWVILSCAILLIARNLLINRKAENAGIHASSPFATHFFILTGALIGFSALIYSFEVTSSITSIINNNYKVLTIFIGIVLVLICYFIAISICRRTIKHKLKSFIPAVSFSGITVLLAVILATGGFGYTNYIPDSDKIESAIVTSSYTDGFGSETHMSYYEDSFIYDIFSNESSDYGNVIGVFTDSEDLQKVFELHKKLVKTSDTMSDRKCSVIYNLKNGKTVVRIYTTTDIQAAYEVLSLRDTKAYMEELDYLLNENSNVTETAEKKLENTEYASNLLFKDEEKNAKTIIQNGYIQVVKANGLFNFDNMIENTPELRRALLADLKNQTYEDRHKPQEKAIGMIIFLAYSDDYAGKWDPYFESDYAYTESIYLENTEDLKPYELDPEFYGYYNGGFYIYPSMTNTVNYLKSTGEYNYFEDDITEGLVSIQAIKPSDAVLYDEYLAYYTLFTSQNQLLIEDLSDEEFDLYPSMKKYFDASKKITDKNQMKELTEKSTIYKIADQDDTLLLLEYSDGRTYTRILTNENTPEWAF